jgi:hypothetical protein
VKYDLNGWLGVLAGPFEYLQNSLKSMREAAKKANKDLNNFRVILLTYPNIIESKDSSDQNQRMPMSGTVEQIGTDIEKIKQMGIDHIVFGYNFAPIYKDVSNIVDITKQLSKFAR